MSNTKEDRAGTVTHVCNPTALQSLRQRSFRLETNVGHIVSSEFQAWGS